MAGKKENFELTMFFVTFNILRLKIREKIKLRDCSLIEQDFT